jgi:arylamine N-acetyltransferase
VLVANHYTATHPASMFRRTITIQRLVGNDHLTLRNETLTRYRNGHLSDEPIARAQVPHVARELFDVEWPTGPLLYESYLAETVTK